MTNLFVTFSGFIKNSFSRYKVQPQVSQAATQNVWLRNWKTEKSLHKSKYSIIFSKHSWKKLSAA